jgi:hypothetical protein
MSSSEPMTISSAPMSIQRCRAVPRMAVSRVRTTAAAPAPRKVERQPPREAERQHDGDHLDDLDR